MTHEDGTGNPFHLVLVLVAIGTVIVRWRSFESRNVVWIVLCSVAGALIFCTLLRWQPWHSRLHLPLFAIYSVPCGIVLARQWLGVRCLAGLLLLWSAAPALITNYSRPLGGERSIFTQPRQQQYFTNRSLLASAYLAVADAVRGTSCRQIGLLLGGDDYEYPLWALLVQTQSSRDPPRIEHVAVTNPSAKYRIEPFHPCLVIASNIRDDEIFLPEGHFLAQSTATRAPTDTALRLFEAAPQDTP